ncbi:rhomboid 4 [Babesia divergens]|uniref:Rhomboid-like protease n=1 Tax=Babesia divergens TaxID=32595 RepID=A0AAD9LKI1_BABDI|nr:rhomboid 4 [Babesia divergens]
MAGMDEGHPSNSEGGDAPKKSRVADILDSGIFTRGKKSSGSTADAAANSNAQSSERVSDAANASVTQEKPQQRALMLAEKYEKRLAGGKTSKTSTPDAASSSAPAASSSPAVSKRSVKPTTSTSSGTAATRRHTTQQKIHTLSDIDSTDGTRDATVADDRRKDNATSFSSPAGRTRRAKCLLRRNVKEPIFPGKLILTISTTTAMLLMFVFQLFINLMTFNGRCMSKVDYSVRMGGKPIFSPLGYVACERNLMTKASDRGTFGYAAVDRGFPPENVYTGHLGASEASVDGPNHRLVDSIGCVNSNKIRLYGETFRLWTAIFLHAGVQHILLNMFVNVQLLYVIEPDWGFCRTLVVYLLSGYIGNLTHGSMAPCINAVGASGSVFGLCGALIPYCIEHWDTLIAPQYLVLESMVFLLFELFLPNGSTSTWAHLGGYIAGLCLGFMTIKSVSLFDRGTIIQRLALRWFPNKLSDERRQKYRAEVLKATQAEEMRRIQYEKEAKANGKKFRFLKRLLGIYPYGPYRNRLRDVITRTVFLCIGGLFFSYFYMAMHVESFYSKINAETSPIFCKHCYCGYILDSHPLEVVNAHISNVTGKFYCFLNRETYNLYCDEQTRDLVAMRVALEAPGPHKDL